MQWDISLFRCGLFSGGPELNRIYTFLKAFIIIIFFSDQRFDYLAHISIDTRPILILYHYTFSLSFFLLLEFRQVDV